MPNKTDRISLRTVRRAPSPKSCEPAGSRGACKDINVSIPGSLLVARRPGLNAMRSIEKLGRAILRETGRKLATPARKDFGVGARQRIGGEDVLAPKIEPLLEIRGVMLGELARSTKQVLDIVRDEPIRRRLMSAPGVSPLTALALRATIDQPERFRKSRDVGAPLGLTP